MENRRLSFLLILLKATIEADLADGDTTMSFPGLCAWTAYMYDARMIDGTEHNLLYSYIIQNRPSKWSSWQAFKAHEDGNGWFWDKYKAKPRLKWLRKHIRLLKEEQL